MPGVAVKDLKLGKKLGRVHDPRTLNLAMFMSSIAPVVVPPSWRIGKARHEVPIFGNQIYSDCTYATHGHRVIVQEHAAGQAREVQLSDQDVIDAYFHLTGGRDDGAYMLDVANSMRHVGLGRERDGTPHTVSGFVEVNRGRFDQVRLGMSVFGGLALGIWLPLSAQAETSPGGVWTLPERLSGDGEPGSWGGHSVYGIGYDKDTVLCYTWGQEQRMTWSFFANYVDEAYAFVTEDYLYKSKQVTPKGLNLSSLLGYLNEIRA